MTHNNSHHAHTPPLSPHMPKEKEEENFFLVPPKFLLTAVIGMGVLIVLGLAVLIAVIVHRLSTPKKSLAIASVESPLSAEACFPATDLTAGQKPLPPLSLTLSQGEHLAHITRAAGCVFALQIVGPEGEKILLWDSLKGRITTGITFTVSPTLPASTK
ncbi:MAG: hypothetical protein IJ934_02535 [Acetobacter sp.]|nr:hypothetical protein [Acetobacter sp.]